MTNSIYNFAQLYKITHIPTEQFYYGSCWAEGKTYLDRFQEHLSGRGGVYIKKLIEDGAPKDDFKTELLGIYPLDECKQREADLAKTSLYPVGLNGNSGSFVVQTEKVRQKMSEAKKGIPCSEEAKRKISEALTNLPKSEEHKRNMSNAHKGVLIGPMSEEHKRKISESHKGVPKGPFSEEHRRRISEAKRNRSTLKSIPA